MGFDSSIPLGKATDYQFEYNPKLLFPIARSAGRELIGIDNHSLPFQGFDRWTAFELSWLNEKGKPQQAVAEFDFSAAAPNIVESKSFKLYLNSFNQSQFASINEVLQVLKSDLSDVSGKAVEVRLFGVNQYPRTHSNGENLLQLDDLDVSCSEYEVNANLLQLDTEKAAEKIENSIFCFDGFRSLCPVTSQPDWATVSIHLSGAQINAESLLQYLVSFRHHQGFHEQCVEQIFYDLTQLGEFEKITVYARFLRRGGLDINPIRSTQALSELFDVMPVVDRQ